MNPSPIQRQRERIHADRLKLRKLAALCRGEMRGTSLDVALDTIAVLDERLDDDLADLDAEEMRLHHQAFRRVVQSMSDIDPSDTYDTEEAHR